MPVAAFDIIGTLFSLERPRDELMALGAPHDALELWFAESLRDYFARSHSGGYAPLADILSAALARMLARLGAPAGADEVGQVMAAMRELDPAPGAHEGVETLREAGWRVLALTNGSEELTRTLLERAGLARHFAAVRSCDAIEVSKPDPRVYAMARAEAGGEDLWLIAAHAWDVAGAMRAGLGGAWVSSKEGAFLSAYPEPDVQGADIAAVARALVGRPG